MLCRNREAHLFFATAFGFYRAHDAGVQHVSSNVWTVPDEQVKGMQWTGTLRRICSCDGTTVIMGAIINTQIQQQQY